MCSQYLKNSYQVTVMNESENMSLKEESQENQFPASHHDSSFNQEDLESDHDNSALQLSEEEMDKNMSDESVEGDEEASQKKREPKEAHTAQFEAFLKSFQEQTDPDLKLQLAIDFMEDALAQGGTPHFRSFWEARRLCLPLFKENISAALRSQLWNRYSELSKEARRLKEILDEQSAFAVEQIEIAIQALENDIQQFDEQVEKAALSDDLVFPQVLREHRQFYQDLQKQLNVLNVQASRINALRKELLKTEMRVRQKNKFFQRLSAAGDSVFPKRKDLIKQISQQFVEDVNQFIKTHFGQGDSQESLFVLREEIKALQGLAKVLTLNTNSFTQTRTRLSECWDKIKIEEKERKKERAQQKVVFKQNADVVREQIQTAKEFVEKEDSSLSESQKKLEEIVTLMRRTELGRDELKFLRDELSGVRKIIQDRVKAEEDARHQQEQERNRQKKEKYNSFREMAENLVRQADSYDVEQLMAERDQVLSQLQESTLTKNEKLEIERLLKPLKDIITDKSEKALLALSEDDRHALQQLQDILSQRKERRQEIKKQLEIYRKAAGSSSLDFEKAMSFTAQINEEKERLEKANQGIIEIERKITDLQSKMKGGRS
ncbi:conserved hypothetical protein [Candidatus Protochlamydia naegleriophila]|uniref:Myosin heavy chain n=2 Tax=Candidatus Protochlamydia naegleriophila TaxID=389348 RepID=A0A0U5JEE6_9BACT|nr:conserved hypothetical protein [Candidatus Protochlamydia naegleriophila]